MAQNSTDLAQAVGLRPVDDGTALPQAGVYEVDSTHSVVEFAVRHLGLAKVRGHFNSFQGTLRIADDPSSSSLEASVDAASIDTGDSMRDNHLRSPEFLDVERHPTLQFQSTRIRRGPEGQWLLDGDLTVRGVSRPVAFEVEFEGSARDPWGNARIGFSATTEVNRDDFGLTWNQPLDAGGWLVGKQVKIELSVEAVREQEQ